jgi:hypothetical protein
MAAPYVTETGETFSPTLGQGVVRLQLVSDETQKDLPP